MLTEKVSDTIAHYDMVQSGARLLVGLSGGPDSVALTEVLRELGYELVLAHLDHALREDSGEDVAFCREFATRLGVAYVTERRDVGAEAAFERRSLEEAGRRARYAFLEREANRHGCHHIAVGHTRDDQAETVLMRLVRGAGTAGLAGMPPVRGRIVRPLIEVGRRDVEDYLRQRNVPFREDPSNRDLRFSRNRTRHELIPALERGLNPRVSDALARTADLLREDEAWMQTLARETFESLGRRLSDGSGVILSARELRTKPRALARRLVRMALVGARAGEEAFTLAHVEDVLTLARGGQSGREIHLPGLVVARSFDELRFRTGSGRSGQRSPKRGYNGYEYRLPIPADVHLVEPAGTLSARPLGVVAAGRGRGDEPAASGNRVVVGWEGRPAELSVRSPRRGDRFHPFGAPGSKPLSRYLMEQRVSRENRPHVPVVVRPRGRGERDEILWVVGHAIAEAGRRRPHAEALELEWVSH